MGRWRFVMKRISPERKSAALAKLLPLYNMSVASVSQSDGISEATLYYWRSQTKAEGKPVPGTGKTAEQWPAEARLAVIIETAILTETELAEYYHKKGLYTEHSSVFPYVLVLLSYTDVSVSDNSLSRVISLT